MKLTVHISDCGLPPTGKREAPGVIFPTKGTEAIAGEETTQGSSST
jgi:hypothetical protein